MKKTKIVEAFEKWRASPLLGCCGEINNLKNHWGRNKVPITRTLPDGREVQGYETKDYPLADKYVCERERLWREYISIRDGINYHIEPLK